MPRGRVFRESAVHAPSTAYTLGYFAVEGAKSLVIRVRNHGGNAADRYATFALNARWRLADGTTTTTPTAVTVGAAGSSIYGINWLGAFTGDLTVGATGRVSAWSNEAAADDDRGSAIVFPPGLELAFIATRDANNNATFTADWAVLINDEYPATKIASLSKLT